MKLFCPLAPCKPAEVKRPDAYTAQSFATTEAYLRHIEKGHFIAPRNAPSAYVA